MSDSHDIDQSQAGHHPDEEERIVVMRLQKFLARAGAASRRGSEDLMTAGRVTVNGEVVTELGAKVDPATDTVTLDGIEIRLASGPVYLALNKPSGVVTTMRDPQGRPTVAELVPTAQYPGLFPVGRLDFETTGLLLFTTDGELSHRLLHPKWKVPKTYLVEVDGVPDPKDMKALREGIKLDDGMTAPAQARTIERRGDHALIEVTISEGRKRQVRRMLSAVKHPVRVLHRISFGPVALGRLAESGVRELTQEEVYALKSAVEMGE